MNHAILVNIWHERSEPYEDVVFYPLVDLLPAFNRLPTEECAMPLLSQHTLERSTLEFRGVSACTIASCVYTIP